MQLNFSLYFSCCLRGCLWLPMKSGVVQIYIKRRKRFPLRGCSKSSFWRLLKIKCSIGRGECSEDKNGYIRSLLKMKYNFITSNIFLEKSLQLFNLLKNKRISWTFQIRNHSRWFLSKCSVWNEVITEVLQIMSTVHQVSRRSAYLCLAFPCSLLSSFTLFLHQAAAVLASRCKKP